MRALRLIWDAVGGKLFLFPAAVSGGLALLDKTELGEVVMPITWLIVAMPLLLWLIVGLIIQALRLQERADLVPTPDWSMRDAFRYLMIGSTRALNTNPDAEGYYNDVQGDLADAARLGRLIIWGREHSDFRGGFRKVLQPFANEDWGRLQVALDTCVYDSPRGPQVVDYSTTQWTRYEDVQVCKAQIMAIWPKAGWLVLRKDPYFKRRKEFQEKELVIGKGHANK